MNYAVDIVGVAPKLSQSLKENVQIWSKSMKHVGSFFPRLAAYGVALTVTSMVASALADEDAALVRAVRGSAQYSEGGAWKAIKVDIKLHQGAIIKTAADSQVDLFLRNNGPVIRVTENSTLGLDKLFFQETGGETVIDTRLNLSNGRILGNVKHMASSSKYEVKIPSGTVGIRGTEYDISANGPVRVQSDGPALVTWVDPTTGRVSQMTVNAGQTFTPPAQPQNPPTVGPTPPDITTGNQVIFTDLNTIITTQPQPPLEPPIKPPVTPTPPSVEIPISPNTPPSGSTTPTTGPQ
jgi:hypothetical protein